MRAIVVYESMFGNTHAVADAIAAGIGPDAVALPVAEATRDAVATADLLVVGAPTHVHGMSRPNTRKWAVDTARKPGASVELDPAATGPGVREWLGSIGTLRCSVAAFDTRLHRPGLLTGRAARGISRGLRGHGCAPIAPPESFFVGADNRLEAGEADRARAWGGRLGARASGTGERAAS